MSTDLSEIIAMGCADLNSNNEGVGGKVVEITGGSRRSSIKQMTATEFVAMRAATDAIAAVAKAEANSDMVLKTATEQKEVTIKNSQSTELINNHEVTVNSGINKMTKPVGRSRITSLPNIMHINEVLEYEYGNDDDEDEDSIENGLDQTEKQQLELQLNKGQMTTVSETEENGDDVKKRSSSKSTGDKDTSSEAHFITADYGEFVTANSSLANSLEQLRQQRLDGGRSDRARRSQSPSLRPINRSLAPDRLNSSSTSSVSSNSVSLSLNTSKNVSRRESDAEETQIATTATVLVTSPPVFPLAKTSSTPNLERRRSSLSALFPGPSPLVTGTTSLHTEPKLLTDEDLSLNQISGIVQETLERRIPEGKAVHRTKTPPPVGVKLGVNLKRVSPPKTHITVKKNEAPMLGVVLRKVEKKQTQQKSILDDDKPLYQLSIVRSDHKEYKPATKVKPPAPLQKSATTTAMAKSTPGGILTGTQLSKTAQQLAVQQKQAYIQQRQQQQLNKTQRPQMGVPITIQKIEGDKIIIIKKIVVPKNSKIPEQYLKVRMSVICDRDFDVDRKTWCCLMC